MLLPARARAGEDKEEAADEADEADDSEEEDEALGRNVRQLIPERRKAFEWRDGHDPDAIAASAGVPAEPPRKARAVTDQQA